MGNGTCYSHHASLSLTLQYIDRGSIASSGSCQRKGREEINQNVGPRPRDLTNRMTPL